MCDSMVAQFLSNSPSWLNEECQQWRHGCEYILLTFVFEVGVGSSMEAIEFWRGRPGARPGIRLSG